MRKLLIFIGAVNFTAAAFVSLARSEKPSKDFWARHGYVLSFFIVLALAAPPLQGWVADAGERKQRKKLEREKTFREILTGTLVNIVDTTGADWKRTGITLFFVQKRWAWRWPPFRFHRAWRFVEFQWFRPPRLEYQEVATRVKNSFTPPPSGIDWTKGKGVVGRCWALRDNVVKDLRVEFQPYAAYGQATWEGLTNDQRFGLDFVAFQRTKEWYGIVGAAPILDKRGEYIGCVSFDTPQDGPVVSEATMNEAVQHARAAAVWVEQAQALAKTG